jgi:RNA polymerase sigma-70 factor, ECF subfamily
MTATSRAAVQERALLDEARGGGEEAFRRIVEEHRSALRAHCYRMLGSLHEAEDAVQETLLRAWRGLPGFGGRSALRSWLFSIATNACLDLIARRPKRVLPIDQGPPARVGDDVGEPLVETVWIEPFPDEVAEPTAPDARYEQREAIELAFVAALQHLPSTQRAVLILRDVLGFSAREVADSLDTSVASVNSALQRARKSVEERLPEQSQQETLRAVGDARIRELVDAYVDAFARGDVEALRALLAEDAVFSMPPWASWWRGRDTIATFAKEAQEYCAEALAVSTRANAQAAVAYYHLDAETGTFLPAAIDVISFEGEQIKDITAFINPGAFSRFGLPPVLACAVARP